MLHLAYAHGGLIAIVFHQIVRVIQGSSHLHYHLHTGFLRQLLDLFIPGPRVSVRVLLEHQMGYLPALEDLGQDGLGRFSYNKKLTLLVQLRNAIGQVLLTIKSAFIVKSASNTLAHGSLRIL